MQEFTVGSKIYIKKRRQQKTTRTITTSKWQLQNGNYKCLQEESEASAFRSFVLCFGSKATNNKQLHN